MDEGISGYRDDSLRSVERNKEEYGLPLAIVSYQQLYGWTMDDIVAAVGKSNNCTFCGVFRRQALDRGAVYLRADKIATGHNADDIAETVLMNVLRGDISRLDRSTHILTGGPGNESPLPRCKPFKYAYEKEIVMYAYYQQLDYFTTECVYAPYAFRGYAREFLKQCERAASASIVDIVRSGEELEVRDDVKETRRRRKAAQLNAANPTDTAAADGDVRLCQRCGYISSNPLCKACVLLEGLNKGRAKREVQQEQKTEADGDEKKEAETDDRRPSTERKEWANEVDVMSGADRERVSAVFGRMGSSSRAQRERGKVEAGVGVTSVASGNGGTAHDRLTFTASTPMSIAEKLQGSSW